ncbi:hypothetical protein EDF67_102452 [Sphingobacterium sp. JUb78]|nr:hypothetical protein EDF66_10292 [Sphingobacterium sp. JUb20]TCR13039.1 hypothetical protein EDF67_102452 [Sphingobacterium sp. JUb78]
MVKQVLIFKSSIKTVESKIFLMQLLQLNMPEVFSPTVDLDDEDSIFRVETAGCSIDRLTNLLDSHNIRVDLLERFDVA